MDTIEHPLTGEKIRIAKADFSYEMIWEQADAACKALGSGWRLPTIEEFEEIYKNKDAIGGFVNVTSYWSSSEVDDKTAWAYCCPIFNVGSGPSDRGCCFRVRAVRPI